MQAQSASYGLIPGKKYLLENETNIRKAKLNKIYTNDAVPSLRG